jgi:hypothetical protein
MLQLTHALLAVAGTAPGNVAPPPAAPAAQETPAQTTTSAQVPPATGAVSSASSAEEDLRRRLEKLEKAHTVEIEDLRSQLEQLEEDVAKARSASQAPPQSSASVFNPSLTVFGNFLARADDKPAYVDDDPDLARVDDRFLLREVELDFRAAIDPWADGVLITSFEAETPGEYEVGVEEGYVLLKKLPILDEAPAGLKVKAGRFRPSFGRLNTIHLHDLPQVSYPRALQNFLGPEGMVADGVSGQFFLPSPGEADTLDATIQLVDGANTPLQPDAEASDLAWVGHVKWFHDISAGKDVEVGASAWVSGSDEQLYGLDATYRWKPFVSGEWKSFLIGFEGFQANLSAEDLAHHPTGFDLWSQYQLGRNVYLGVRYDWFEELEDASQETEVFGAFLTYYTTEFLRFRLGAEHVESDRDTIDGLDTAYLELNFIYGSHPAEPYWVNR